MISATTRARTILPKLTLAAAAMLLTAAAFAQDEKLPDGKAVVAKYIEATGGKAAQEKVHSRVIKGTMEMITQHRTAEMEVYLVHPNKLYRSMTLEGRMIGAVGYDGEVAWEITPGGASIKEGDEKAQFQREADFNALFDLDRYYSKVECAGIEKVDDAECYKVVFTPKSGEPITQFYDKTTWLVTKNVRTSPTAIGPMEIVSYPSDYRAVDGVLQPFKIRQILMGGQFERELTITSIEQNVDIPAERFKLPPQIRALLEKGKPEGEGEKKP